MKGATGLSGTDRIRELVLPGFEGVPLSNVIKFVIKGFRKGVLVTRASSIAFNLLMALLPASIFLFTLILKWIVIVLLLFLAISFLYWLAPAKKI